MANNPTLDAMVAIFDQHKSEGKKTVGTVNWNW